MEVTYKHEIKKRTRHIFYEGDKYHRRCMYGMFKIYIIAFLGINKCQIEYLSGRQELIEVDNEELKLIEYKS